MLSEVGICFFLDLLDLEWFGIGDMHRHSAANDIESM